MFHTPKNAVYKRINRRKFLELGGGYASALGVGSLTLGLGSTITRTRAQAQSSDEAKWKQYAGSKLVFMSENTPPSFAIRDNIKAFTDLTGIEVGTAIDQEIDQCARTHFHGHVQEGPVLVGIAVSTCRMPDASRMRCASARCSSAAFR